MVGIVCIMQSNYLPWKGYFDLVRYADHFVFLDDVQYSKGWRNRNKIKTARGLTWLSVPISHSFSKRQSIDDIAIADPNWSQTHLELIRKCYSAAPYFESTMEWFKPLMSEAGELGKLSDVNQFLIKSISQRLGSKAEFSKSTDVMDRDALKRFDHNADRIVQLTKALGCDVCLNGPTAKAYTDLEYCRLHEVRSLWANYSNYPVYSQQHGEFTHNVSIVDMFMMLGKETANFMKEEGFAQTEC